MKASALFPAFSAGELSELLHRRIDLTKFGIGCRRVHNMLPLPEGPLVRRPGTEYRDAARVLNANATFLRPFVFGPLDAWLLEFSQSTLRFWHEGGLVLDGGSPYEVATSWLESDLTTDEGTFALSLAQARDRVFITGGNRPAKVLSRNAATDWTLETFDPKDGPFTKLNEEEANTVYVSSGSNVVGALINLTKSSAFDFPPEGMTMAADRYRLRIFAGGDDVTRPWVAGASIGSTGAERYNGKNTYESTSTGTAGGIPPVHTFGLGRDGNPGVTWEYLHSGYGVLEYYGTTADPLVTQWRIVELLPSSLFSASTPSHLWQGSEWGLSAGGFANGIFEPQAVAFAFDRLVVARDTKLWFSVLDDYFSFADREFDEILAESAITIELKGRGVTRIQWLEETAAGLLVGTDGGEFLVSPANAAEVFGSVRDGTRNVQAVRQTTYGSKAIEPVLAHGRLMQIDITGRKLRELDRNIEKDRVVGFELTSLASHILAPAVRWMAWQPAPDNLLWLGLTDGRLVSCTYLPEQEVTAFATHQLGADSTGVAIVEDGCVMPSDDGTRSELWLVVRRNTTNPPRRTIERLAPRWDFAGNLTSADSRHLDSHLLYEGAATTSLSGAGHLANETVRVVADGRQADLALNGSGAGTLTDAASKVCLGLRFTSGVEFLVPDVGGRDGPAPGKLRRTRRLIFGLLQSAEPFKAGEVGKLRTFDRTDLTAELGQPVPLISDDIKVPCDLGWHRRPLHGAEVDSGLPWCIATAMMRLEVTE